MSRSDIPRWTKHDPLGLARMRKNPKGEFILYADHVKVLRQRVAERMAELATQFDALSGAVIHDRARIVDGLAGVRQWGSIRRPDGTFVELIDKAEVLALLGIPPSTPTEHASELESKRYFTEAPEEGFQW